MQTISVVTAVAYESRSDSIGGSRRLGDIEKGTCGLRLESCGRQYVEKRRPMAIAIIDMASC
jgi:hypothetical protein